MRTNIRRFGFTLIEVLVVMAIIMLLAGISMPVYHKVRSGGYDAQCVANLKAIGTAFDNYRNEFDGWMPHALYNTSPSDRLRKDVTFASAHESMEWKYQLSFILGNLPRSRMFAKDFYVTGHFFDPVKGKGQGNYFLSKRHFGAKIEMKPTGGTGWTPITQWTNIRKHRADSATGMDGLALEEVRAFGYMPYWSWKEPSRAAIVAPAKNPRMHRGYGRNSATDVNVDYRHSGHANILFLDGHVDTFEKGDNSLFDLFDKKYEILDANAKLQWDRGARIRQRDNE